MENLSYRRSQSATLKEQAAYNERFKLVITHIHAAKDVDQILVTFHDEILSLFDAERLCTLCGRYGTERSVFTLLRSRQGAGDSCPT